MLIETGYDLRTLGTERVILVINTEYGPIEDLPFDIRPRRIIPYSMSADAENKSGERNRLSGVLEKAIRGIVELGQVGRGPKLSPLESLERYMKLKELTDQQRFYEAENLLPGLENYQDVPM